MSSDSNGAGRILSSLPIGERVGIAFSGGLDTCCALAWMREKGALPYAFTANLGQNDDPGRTAKRALSTGASAVHVADLREKFVGDYIFPALQANVVYENGLIGFLK